MSTPATFETNGHIGVPEMYGDPVNQIYHLVDQYNKQGTELYDEILIGEKRAKVMYLAMLAMGGENGMAGIVIGPPGGGKSVLVENGHTIIDGIEPEHVAWVPHRQDLTPAQLVGESSEMIRRGTKDGVSFEERFSGEVVPILRPGIKVVQLDEVSRTSPLALNAGLKMFQDGFIEVVHEDKRVVVSKFDLLASSMNNHGTLFTNRFDPAIINRHGMGTFMGMREPGQLSEAGNTIWDNPHNIYKSQPAPGKAIDLADLHRVREVIQYVPMHQPERELGKRLEAGMLDAMAEKQLDSADGRLASQLVRISQTLALLNRRKAVAEEDLREATQYALTARLGMIGVKPAEIEQISNSLA